MSETKLCPVCNSETHVTYFGNGSEGIRCMQCEDKHSNKVSEDSSDVETD